MDLRRGVLLAAMVILLIATYVQADFLFNRPTIYIEDDMKCQPGHTVLKMSPAYKPIYQNPDDEEKYGKSHKKEKKENIRQLTIEENDSFEQFLRRAELTNVTSTNITTTVKTDSAVTTANIAETATTANPTTAAPTVNANDTATTVNTNIAATTVKTDTAAPIPKMDNVPIAKTPSPSPINKPPKKLLPIKPKTPLYKKYANEKCQICVCSVDGKDEYCSVRPAMNLNECVLYGKAMQGGPEKLKVKGIGPFQKERVLALMIRRDLIWHDGEIPYAPKAKCRRGRSYYSNSIHANDTDIDVGPDIDSLLGYSNLDVCFFCVCGVSGESVACIHRDPWYCDYYRYLSTENADRDSYTNLFEKDVPAYFRTLSYRLRRTMDRGTIDLLEAGGDTLCCGHPNGHRRAIHTKARSKLHAFKKQKLQKENLMKSHDGPQQDYVDFVVNND